MLLSIFEKSQVQHVMHSVELGHKVCPGSVTNVVYCGCLTKPHSSSVHLCHKKQQKMHLRPESKVYMLNNSVND